MVIPGYTYSMKTAISVPDDTFNRVSRRAKDLGLSRSEFFALAANSYLDKLDTHSLAEQINSALNQIGVQDEFHAAAVEEGHRLLLATDEQW